ncbi:MAG: monovalent cation/H(+) antiporter subunit G [Dorea sp.]|nr:monovalent cation/H(+) antiporter subunit G [Dorea sp.]
MSALSWIQFILGAVCLLAGLVFYVIQFIGVFRFKYVMNRMHAAAIGDTLGADLMLLGTIILFGFSWASLKIIFVVTFLWMSAPVASHMLAKLEIESKYEMTDCCPVKDAEELGGEE